MIIMVGKRTASRSASRDRYADPLQANNQLLPIISNHSPPRIKVKAFWRVTVKSVTQLKWRILPDLISQYSRKLTRPSALEALSGTSFIK